MCIAHAQPHAVAPPTHPSLPPPAFCPAAHKTEAQDFKAKYEECEKANADVLAGSTPATATKGDAEADAEADKLADEVAAKAGVEEKEQE